MRSLYKACKKIKPSVISLMTTVPDYRSALINYSGLLNDEVVYEIVKDAYLKMLKNDSTTRTAKRVLKSISRDVTGNSSAWEDGVSEELLSKALLRQELKYAISSKFLYKVYNNDMLSSAFRENNVKDDYQAYEVLKDIFFRMICDNYKNSDDQKKRVLYFRVRQIVEGFAESLTGDPKAWRKDYNLRTQTIQKAARDGTFEKIELSQSQLEAELLADRMLPDADDDL